ncbi:MAG: DUF4328 domain-containing protein [Pirellulales bacterium]|nr:DUF4328 domain-containing protein [Pirellulales bacterium]
MEERTNPYAAPEEVSSDELMMAESVESNRIVSYESAGTRAGWARGFLTAELVLAVANIVFLVWEIDFARRIAVGQFTNEDVAAEGTMLLLLHFMGMIVSIGSVVAFLMWFHRVHRNLPSLGARMLQFTPAWAVGYWFIPIMNLFRPYQVMREIWQASDPALLQSPFSTRVATRVSSAVVGWWWALFLVMGWLGNIGSRIQTIENSTEMFIVGAWILIASNLITVPAALLAIHLVRRTTSNQEECFRLLGESALSTAT